MIMMEIGTLWYDNDKSSSLEAKILRAARYHQGKYGETPNTCFASAETIAAGGGGGDQSEDEKRPQLVFGEIVVRESSSVQKNHFWIGIDRSGKTPTATHQQHQT